MLVGDDRSPPFATRKGTEAGGDAPRVVGQHDNNKFIDCRNDGDGQGDKVLAAGRNTWELVQTNLVDDLRKLVRARDLALAEQRTRHVKESITIREQRLALESGRHFAEKIAKLFGWADTPARPETSLPVSFASSVDACGKRNTLLNGAQGGGDAYSGYVENVSDVQIPNNEQLHSMSLGSSLKVVGDEDGGSRKSLTVADAMATTIVANNKNTTCPRCLDLQRRLDIAVTDRTLAEAELVSLRRVIAPVDTSWEWEHGFGTEDGCTGNAMRPGGVSEHGNIARTPPLAGAGEKDCAGLQEELLWLGQMVSLSEGGVPSSNGDIQAFETRQNNKITEKGGLPTKELALQPETAAMDNENPSLAASLSATVENSARHFEQVTRRRLLRRGAKADLRAARIKLDALLSTLPKRPADAKHTDLEKGGHAPNQHNRQGTAEDMGETGKGGEKRIHNKNVHAPITCPAKHSAGPGIASRYGRGHRTDTYHCGRGAVGGRRNASIDSSDFETACPRSSCTVTTPKVSRRAVEGRSATPRKDDRGGAGTATKASFKRTEKPQTRVDCGQPLATTVPENERQSPDTSSIDKRAEGGVIVLTADDKECDLPSSACDEGGSPEVAYEKASKQVQSSFVDDAAADTAGEDRGESTADVESPEHVAAFAVISTDIGKPEVMDDQQADRLSSSAANDKEQCFDNKDKDKDEKSCGYPKGDGSDASTSSHPHSFVTPAPAKINNGKKIKMSPKSKETNCGTSRGMLRLNQKRRAQGVLRKPQGTPRSSRVDRSKSPRSNTASAVEEQSQPLQPGAEDHSEITANSMTIAPAGGAQSDSSSVCNARRDDCQDQCRSLETSPKVDAVADGGPFNVLGGDAAPNTATKPPVPVAQDDDTADGLEIVAPNGQTKGAKPNRSRTSKVQVGSKAAAQTVKKSVARLPRKFAKVAKQPVARAVVNTPTRVRIAADARRMSETEVSPARNCTEDTPSSVNQVTPHNELDAMSQADDVREPTNLEVDILLQVENAPCQKSSTNTDDDRVEEREVGEGQTTNGREIVVELPPASAQLAVRHDVAVEFADNCTTTARSNKKNDEADALSIDVGDDGLGCGGTVTSKQPDAYGTANGGCLLDGVDWVEALRADVDRLRLEKAELEDTVAQLNVAAAQLYLVEYAQMKAKCRQLKRVVLGSGSRPTDDASRYGHSCQEVMHRLKLIGVNFFRRRIGGVMGGKFFPDGLTRALTLIGRSVVAQGCQTVPVGLDPLIQHNASPPPESRDVYVQVAGGIDVEDEPLMEQQVYALLGKLDLLLKRREDVLSSYHREAEEGAREARALLATAAVQHQAEQGWGVSRVPNVRDLVARREGPAGAPRPALNPTNLLFTAAVVLDSITTTPPIQEPIASATRIVAADETQEEHDGGSRRRRYSPAEKALLELVDEIVAALESEQRRSDASAERRRLVSENHNNGNRKYGATEPLRRPPAGVPPLVWDMGIHLVGKLAQAFRRAVEARGFEREVADADLVAAVTLGRSASAGSDRWHVEHRMLSALQGGEVHDEEGTHQKVQDDEKTKQEFDWGVSNYTDFRNYRPKKGTVASGGNAAARSTSACPKSSSQTSPSKKTADCMRQQSARRAKDNRATGNGYGAAPSRAAALGGPRQPKTAYPNRGGAGSCTKQVQPRYSSAAVALVEAVAFDTVRPSLLHPRPASALVEDRNRFDRRGGHGTYLPGERGGFNSQREQEERERPRPQSARRAEQHDFLGGGGAVGRSSTYNVKTQREGWAHEGGIEPTTRQPMRPATNAARPASAGGRIIDTRTWSSSVVKPGVFRCRPQNNRASVRFETVARSSLPAHAGEVPKFLARKERELVEREKAAAVHGRFEFISDCNEGSVSQAQGDSTGDSRGAKEKTTTRAAELGCQENGFPGDDSYGCGVLPSARLEESTYTEGLLPHAGEQAFFDEWKPTDYGIDLSRYD